MNVYKRWCSRAGNSPYTPIPLHFPSRENVGMSHHCMLTRPPVYSVCVHTCVFNIRKIPKMFAQRILLFPVHFIWCIPGRKKPSGLKFRMKSQTSVDPLLSLDANEALSGVLEYMHSEDQAIREKFSILKNRLITESGIASNVSSGMLVFKLPFGRLLWLHPHQCCDSGQWCSFEANPPDCPIYCAAVQFSEWFCSA